MSDSEIPNGWVVKNLIPVDPNTINDYFTITSTSTQKYISFEINVNVDSLYYSYDDFKWEVFNTSQDNNTLLIGLLKGQKVRFKAINTLDKTTTFSFDHTFPFKQSINISGNIQTLSVGDDYKNLQNKATYCKNLFANTENVTFDGLLLPATKLQEDCYANMFENCKGLTSIPEGLLPATTLASNCYSEMFESCINLTSIPEGLLPATTLASGCY